MKTTEEQREIVVEVPTDGQGSLRERKKARLQASLREATLAVIEERGYEGATVQEIVRRVDVSQPTFYNYFSSIDDVLRELAGERIEQWTAAVHRRSERRSSDDSAVRRLMVLYRHMATQMGREKTLWRAAVQGHAFRPTTDPRQKAADTQGRTYIERIMADGQAAGEIDDRRSANRLTWLLAAIQTGALFEWAMPESEPNSLWPRFRENLEFFFEAVVKTNGG